VTTAERIDVTQPQPVRYCIPTEIRDQQIRLNTRRVAGRITKGETRTEPLAIVCYGPSLNDTWEQVKDFRYVMTCSGAHRFMIDRDVVPTWHVDVDPREHKIALIGAPHADVEYLLASTCHPKYFDMLQSGGFTVKLWHVFDTNEDAVRTLPPGEWALFGGCDAGLRAMVVAHFLGFSDLHMFGMDQCEGATGKHAASHPNQPAGARETTVDGETFRTTPAMAECARTLPHELDQLPGVTATFHGHGLAQAIMRSYVRTPVKAGTPLVAFQKPELISAEMVDLNRRLHETNVAYGIGGAKHAPVVRQLVTATKADSVLDYGCGKGRLAAALPFPIWEYDPAIPEKAESPRPADLVVCTDVLEHIEPERLVLVLDDLRRCVRKVGYFVIHTGPAAKTLADGRNAHLIQKGEGWWRTRLSLFFTVAKVIRKGMELHVVVSPKGAA
jgi:uncharacterized Rossmann fold enzyme